MKWTLFIAQLGHSWVACLLARPASVSTGAASMARPLCDPTDKLRQRVDWTRKSARRWSSGMVYDVVFTFTSGGVSSLRKAEPAAPPCWLPMRPGRAIERRDHHGGALKARCAAARCHLHFYWRCNNCVQPILVGRSLCRLQGNAVWPHERSSLRES